jgi:phosphoesterase RecJ-like protein
MTATMGADQDQAAAMMKSAERVAVVSHERPDGDAVGSLLSLTLSLTMAGKEVVPVLSDGVPSRFNFLPGSARVKHHLPNDCDLLIAVDSSDLERLGFQPAEIPRVVDLNIDHHPTNTGFGRINLVEDERASTTEILHAWLPRWGLPTNAEVATCLLTGLVTDTIGFRTTSVSAGVLRAAADLVEQGADLSEIYDRSLGRNSIEGLRYWGRGLSTLSTAEGVIWSSLSLEDRAAAGYPRPDDADLVNILTTAGDYEVALVFVEQAREKVKISWRSRPGVDVAHIAASFGGGGHQRAAGALVEGALKDVVDRVLQVTMKEIQAQKLEA